MSDPATIEIVFAWLLGVHGAVIIWLLFERDHVMKRLIALEGAKPNE